MGILVTLILLGFVAWLTGGSGYAFIAGIFLLIFIGVWSANAAGILPNIPSVVGAILGWMTILCLVVIVWATWNARGKPWLETKKAEAKAEEAAEKAATPQLAQVSSSREALLLEQECLTPCNRFVGWSYKVRTNGDPIGIKYHGCTDWFNQPGKGDFSAPNCFRPGKAEFKSLDENNPRVPVQVYKRITVRR